MRSKPPSKFEFDLLAHLAEHDALAVREIFDGFGKPRGYVRGTIVKAMDRLLKKGLVTRELVDGAFMYRAVQRKEDLDQALVESFVKDRLGGRLAPIATYLSGAPDLDPADLAKLRELLQKMEP